MRVSSVLFLHYSNLNNSFFLHEKEWILFYRVDVDMNIGFNICSHNTDRTADTIFDYNKSIEIILEPKNGTM